uniref:Prolyl 4-hydroxylase alpha subunit Fe(2+) 2OG dioxygenase domain-containing protein n=2 Tax=Emiliania huxleyi TaxID=2903 RepID=A0A6U8NBC9_EMIHU
MFMGAYLIEDESVCDGLVALFEKDPGALAPGVVGRDGRAVIDPTSKESLEYSFQPDDARIEWRRYVTALQACTMKYTARYPYAANHVSPWGLSCTTNYQYYPPGGGYKIYHTERNGRMEPGASRHLVFMTYLNDVSDEGGTQWCPPARHVHSHVHDASETCLPQARSSSTKT